MKTTNGLSQQYRILLAAYGLEKQGNERFLAEDLIVAAWKCYPEIFGLRNYRSLYPDSNKVLTGIVGGRGLLHKGHLIKMGPKQYAVTLHGRATAARLMGESEPETEDLVALPKEKEAFLRRLLGSSAVEKFENHRKNELAFADACRFWDISQNLKGNAVNERLDLVEKTLHELEQDLAQKDAKLNTGRVVSAGDVRVLRHVHCYLMDRFERILNLLRHRLPA